MSSTIDSPTETERVDALLDQLMPRQGPAWRRFVVGVALTAVVVALGVAWFQGRLVPRPAANGSYGGGGGTFTLVPQQGAGADGDALAVSLYMPNLSQRDLRLTRAALDAPGLEILDVGAVVEPPFDYDRATCTSSAGVTQCVAEGPALDDANCTTDDGVTVCGYGPDDTIPGLVSSAWPDNRAALPVTVPAGGSVRLHFLVRPTQCSGPAAYPWGLLDATFDFGPGAWPPWSNTVRGQEVLASGAADLRIQSADGSLVYPPAVGPGQPPDRGFLAAACELTR